jgi:hypothetical protein
MRADPLPGISWTVSFLIPRYDRSFGPDRVASIHVLVLTSLLVGEHPETAQKPQTNPNFLDDRKDVATNELTKWRIEFPPSRAWRDKLQEAACPAKEKDDT